MGQLPMAQGRSGAVVRRVGDRVVKSAVGALGVAQLAAERDRTAWLSQTGVRCPRVLDWDESPDAAALTTSLLPGVPVSSLRRPEPAALVAIATMVAEIHALPVAECPFDSGVTAMVAQAAERTARGEVEESDFDHDWIGRSAESLLAELRGGADVASKLADDDLVVAHGDPCLPNLLVDPDLFHPVGVVDLGRLGVSDRYRDLALLHRSTARTNAQVWGEGPAEQLLSLLSRGVPDRDRMRFYRLLDEFF